MIVASLVPKQLNAHCAEDGCDRKIALRGLCQNHYGQAMKSGAIKKIDFGNKECTVYGCDRVRKSIGYCNTHYRRYRKCGSVGAPIIRDKKLNLPVPVLGAVRSKKNNTATGDRIKELVAQALTRKVRADRLRARGFVPQP
jgi:hypothetical protein